MLGFVDTINARWRADRAGRATGPVRRTRRADWNAAVSLAGILLVTFSGLGCSKDEENGGGVSAAELTDQGWQAFEQADYAQALDAFAGAVAVDEEHGPAHIGLGWAGLLAAGDEDDLAAAVTSFTVAEDLGESGADLYGGRGAARLALAGDALEAGITDAWTARTLDPDFVFVHRESFDAADLALVEAFARAAQARYAEALGAAEEVAASGIDPNDAGTWIVEGQSFATLAETVLAYLQTLSNQECIDEG